MKSEVFKAEGVQSSKNGTIMHTHTHTKTHTDSKNRSQIHMILKFMYRKRDPPITATV